MVAVAITIDNVTGALNALSKTMPADIARKTFVAAEMLAGVVRREVLDTFDAKTGGLARSWKAEVIETKDGEAVAGAFSDLIYADIQDRGDVIRPRTQRALAVPIKAAGIPIGKWPRNFPKGELHFIPRKGKPPLLAKVSKTRTTPMFVLKRSVTIKPTGYIDKAARRAEPEVEEILGDAIDLAVKREVED